MLALPAGSATLPRTFDVVVLGCGLIGLACARALARAGLRTALVGVRTAGEASAASAGMLAPGVEQDGTGRNRFARLSRDRYPELLEELLTETGVRIALNRRGILELALDETEASRLSARAGSESAEWLDPQHLAGLERALAHAAGALLHAGDGAVDNLSLLHALRLFAERSPAIHVVHGRAVQLERGASGAPLLVRTGEGDRIRAARVVLALGAWTALLRGLPRPLPVQPLRGQLLTLAAAPVHHVCYGAHGYLAPRPGGHTLVGTTMERTGFRIGTSEAGANTLRQVARRLCPPLAGACELARWSGLRPVTPDFLPIIGADPEDERVIYACGHSRNGVLLAPLTAESVTALAAGAEPPFPLDRFSVRRFQEQ